MGVVLEYWPVMLASAMVVGAWFERRATLDQHGQILTKLTLALETLDTAVDNLNVTVARMDQRLINIEARAA